MVVVFMLVSLYVWVVSRCSTWCYLSRSWEHPLRTFGVCGTARGYGVVVGAGCNVVVGSDVGVVPGVGARAVRGAAEGEHRATRAAAHALRGTRRYAPAAHRERHSADDARRRRQPPARRPPLPAPPSAPPRWAAAPPSLHLLSLYVSLFWPQNTLHSFESHAIRR